jgi:hypothetical protein
VKPAAGFFCLSLKNHKSSFHANGRFPFIAFVVACATVVRLEAKFSGCMPERAEKTISGRYPDMAAVMYRKDRQKKLDAVQFINRKIQNLNN